MAANSYAKAIRMVHPDINPNLKNAHDLSVVVNQYKDNEYKLNQFISAWQKYGFDYNIQQFINARVNPSARPQSISVNIRDIVKIPTNKKKMPYLTGIIIKLSRVTRGKLYGYHKVTIVDAEKRTWHYKCRTLDNITVTGRATVQEYYEARNAKAPAPEKPKIRQYDFMKIGLGKRIHYYEWRLTKIWAMYQGREYLVHSTGHTKVRLIVPGKKCWLCVLPTEITSTRRETV